MYVKAKAENKGEQSGRLAQVLRNKGEKTPLHQPDRLAEADVPS